MNHHSKTESKFFYRRYNEFIVNMPAWTIHFHIMLREQHIYQKKKKLTRKLCATSIHTCICADSHLNLSTINDEHMHGQRSVSQHNSYWMK